jgi:hypothetical protein
MQIKKKIEDELMGFEEKNIYHKTFLCGTHCETDITVFHEILPQEGLM